MGVRAGGGAGRGVLQAPTPAAKGARGWAWPGRRADVTAGGAPGAATPPGRAVFIASGKQMTERKPSRGWEMRPGARAGQI